jgi:hypothetical protein
MNLPRLPVKVGDQIRVAEADYLYGRGELFLRVTEVQDIQHHSDGPWLNLRGIELRPDGTPLRPEPRHALIRLSALHARHRPPERHS